MRVEQPEHSLGDDPDSLPYYRRGRGDWFPARHPRIWRPPTDVYETDEHVVVKVEVAGMRREDFSISFADRRLVIAGRRQDPTGKLIYQNMEINYGEFRSEVIVGWALDQTAIQADYRDGFLYVLLPKETREYHVRITSGRKRMPAGDAAPDDETSADGSLDGACAQ